jgi:hypothetical protein
MPQNEETVITFWENAVLLELGDKTGMGRNSGFYPSLH